MQHFPGGIQLSRAPLLCAQEWKKVLVYTHGEGDAAVKVHMEVRKDMHAVLSQLLRNRQACADMTIPLNLPAKPEERSPCWQQHPNYHAPCAQVKASHFQAKTGALYQDVRSGGLDAGRRGARPATPFQSHALHIECANIKGTTQSTNLGCVCGSLQGFVRQNYGPKVHVLPYALYSDETCVTLAGAHIHPIILSLCLPLDIVRRQHTHQRIAFLPILAPAQFGMDAKVDKTR